MKLTNVHNLPETIVKALATWKPSTDGFSVSELINSPRIVQLTRRHWDEMTEDVSERIWALLGNSVHYILQKGAVSDSLAEERLVATFNGVKIRGRPDLWHNQVIDDYKVTSVWTVIFSPQGRKEWEKQLNLYRWLYTQSGFNTEKLRVCAILRDWQVSKVGTDSNYPPIPVVVIAIPLWTMADTIKYIGDKLASHLIARNLPDDELPFCSDEETWAKPTQYAIMKDGRKRALSLNDTEEEAKRNLPADNGCYIQERAGARIRCGQYCPARPFCNQDK